MEKIVAMIEKIRVQRKMTKGQLAQLTGVSRNSYTNYLKGSLVPFSKAESMLNMLGMQVLVVDALYIEPYVKPKEPVIPYKHTSKRFKQL